MFHSHKRLGLVVLNRYSRSWFDVSVRQDEVINISSNDAANFSMINSNFVSLKVVRVSSFNLPE